MRPTAGRALLAVALLTTMLPPVGAQGGANPLTGCPADPTGDGAWTLSGTIPAHREGLAAERACTYTMGGGFGQTLPAGTSGPPLSDDPSLRDTLAFVDDDGDGIPRPSDAVYLVLAGASQVRSGDVRMVNPPIGALGSQVRSADGDLGHPLTLMGGGLGYVDDDGDGTFSIGDTLVWDLDDDASVSVSDILFSGPEAGTFVPSGHGLENSPLWFYEGFAMFHDIDGDTTFSLGDVFYLDSDGNGYISAADVRFAPGEDDGVELTLTWAYPDQTAENVGCGIEGDGLVASPDRQAQVAYALGPETQTLPAGAESLATAVLDALSRHAAPCTPEDQLACPQIHHQVDGTTSSLATQAEADEGMVCSYDTPHATLSFEITWEAAADGGSHPACEDPGHVDLELANADGYKARVIWDGGGSDDVGGVQAFAVARLAELEGIAVPCATSASSGTGEADPGSEDPPPDSSPSQDEGGRQDQPPSSSGPAPPSGRTYGEISSQDVQPTPGTRSSAGASPSTDGSATGAGQSAGGDGVSVGMILAIVGGISAAILVGLYVLGSRTSGGPPQPPNGPPSGGPGGWEQAPPTAPPDQPPAGWLPADDEP